MGKKNKAKVKQKQKAAKKAKNILKKGIFKKIKKIKQQSQKASKKSSQQSLSSSVSSKQIQTSGKTGQKPSYTVAIAQIDTLVGDIAGNTQKIIALIEKARDQGAQLIVFPELTVTGYPPKGLLSRPDFADANMQKFIQIVSACKGITAIFGFVNKVNQSLYDAAVCVKDQKIIGIQNKMHLVTHIGQRKYFTEGTSANIMHTGTMRLGIIIAKQNEEETAVEQLVMNGIDLLVWISASPYAVEKNMEPYGILLARKHQIPIVYCNAAGGQENLVFDGGSFAVDKQGLILARGKKFSEDLLFADLSKAGTSFTPAKDQTADVYQALTLGIRSYFTKTGHAKAVIGISGGIDSAVTATLAVHALGKENVFGLVLPSKITSKESLQDAKKICGNLGIAWKQINIDPLVLSASRAVGVAYDKKNISFVEQNIQTRTRAQLLMDFANKNNALLLSSLNKTDLATGYFTMYGEPTGALAPLGDLWKSQIMMLAGYMNTVNKQKSKVIPDSVLKKQPSQELRPNQKDSDDLPSYDLLDKILQLYVVHKKDLHEITQMGFDAELVRKVAFMVAKSEFKRKQIPTVLRISSCAFDSSWNFPSVSGWRG